MTSEASSLVGDFWVILQPPACKFRSRNANSNMSECDGKCKSEISTSCSIKHVVFPRRWPRKIRHRVTRCLHTHTQPLSVESPFQANCNFRDCHGMTPLMEAAVANYGEAWDLGRTHPAVSRCFSGHLQTKAVEKMLGEESTVVGEKAMGVKIPRLFSELFLFPWVYIYIFGFWIVSFTSKRLLYRWLGNVTKYFSCVSLFLIPSQSKLHIRAIMSLWDALDIIYMRLIVVVTDPNLMFGQDNKGKTAQISVSAAVFPAWK